MFEQFWSLYPRKIAKKAAQAEWNKLSTDEQRKCLEVIHNHVKHWKDLNTEPQYIPHPRTWLHQGRFDDELEAVTPKQPEIAWWSSEQLILAKGREVNLDPRPGESIHEFKGRIAEKLRAA